jgi:hypothetical protein
MRHLSRAALILAIAPVLLVTSIVAAADPMAVCAPRSDLIALLKRSAGETQVAQGLSSHGYLIEMFASPAGTWTVLLSQPDGRSCLADAGEAWMMAPADSLHDTIDH